MRSDSEMLVQIASDVAEIKAATKREIVIDNNAPRIVSKSMDVSITYRMVATITKESQPFTILLAMLKPTVTFKPEHLTVYEDLFSKWRDGELAPTVPQPNAEDLTIMRIRADGKDVTVEPMSARNCHLGGGFAWPVVRAGSEVEVALAVSDVVLTRAIPPSGLKMSDLQAVSVLVGLVLSGSG